MSQSWSRHCGIEEKQFTLPGIETRPSSAKPVAILSDLFRLLDCTWVLLCSLTEQCVRKLSSANVSIVAEVTLRAWAAEQWLVKYCVTALKFHLIKLIWSGTRYCKVTCKHISLRLNESIQNLLEGVKIPDTEWLCDESRSLEFESIQNLLEGVKIHSN
jgi:hypothetical protein